MRIVYRPSAVIYLLFSFSILAAPKRSFFFSACEPGAEQQYRCGYRNGGIGAYDNAEADCEGEASQPRAAEDVHYQHDYKGCEGC